MSDKNKIFTVENTITKKKYIFVGSFSEIDVLVNRINNGGVSELNKFTINEKELLEQYYIDTKKITKDTVLVKALINLNDTIDIIKKKILIYCDNYIPKHQHLWVNKKKISEYESIKLKKQYNFRELCSNKTFTCKDNTITGYNDILGIQYNVDNTKHILECDLSQPIRDPDILSTFKDCSHHLLQHYNTINNNTIYLTDYNELKDVVTPNFEYIEQIYFPFIKKDPTTSENYKTIIKDLVKIENKLQDMEELNENKSTIYKNVVFSGKQIDIDIYNIFNNIVLDDVVTFCKYKSRNTSELYKLYKNEITPKIVNSGFKEPKNYFVKYDPELYSYPIERSLLEKWTHSELSNKEKINKKLELDAKNHEYLILKIKYNEEYYDIQLFKDKIVVRYLDKEINFKQIVKLLKFSNKIIQRFVKHITIKLDDLLTTDFIENMNDNKLSFLKLNNNITNYTNFVYKITPEEKEQNKIYINYKKVNNFTSFENIRRYFLKIKNDNKLGVSNFRKTWINETQKLFNLSETDSLQMLTIINETMDAEELKKKPLDIDVNIVISFDRKEEMFNIDAKNCDSFLIIKQIREFINFVFEDSKKSKIKTNPKKDEFVFEVKESKIDEEDDDDDDDDFADLEDNVNNVSLSDNNSDNDGENENDNVEDYDNSATDFEQVQLKKMSIRNYMSEMRKRDNKLFNFKSDTLKTYTKSCGAAPMRQPILLTKTQLNNFEKINPDGFKQLKYIEWGSSSKNKHFVICPRIWCIRDNIALTDDQFIKNKGKCPFCEGEVIDEKGQIGGNNTIIIRLGGDNLYWQDKKEQVNKSSEWLKYLEGTELEAYPGLLASKLHPKNMCMPCCFKKEGSSIKRSKCAITDINYAIDKNLDLKTLVIDGTIKETMLTKEKKETGYIKLEETGSIKLEENDTILLTNQKMTKENNVYIITKDGPEVYDKLTKLEVFIRPGFIINITKGLHKGKSYETTLKKETYVFKENKDIESRIEDKYIQGEDKFPLDKGKLGALYKRLNILLNGNEKLIDDSRLIDGTSQFIRKGVKQNINTSFLSAMASFKGDKDDDTHDQKRIKSKWSAIRLVEEIIKNLGPVEFLGLNNGDLLNLFSSDKFNLDDTLVIKWCKEYPELLDFILNSSPLRNDIKDKIELVKTKNLYNKLTNIIGAFENFKKYCGDMNIPKDPIIFKDLLSRKQDWFSSEKGLNIIIFEKVIKNKVEYLYTHCPVYEDTFKDENKICILYKYNQYYEPIIIAKSSKDVFEPTFVTVFDKKINNYTNGILLNYVKRLYYFTKNNCDWKLDDSLYKTVYDKINYKKFKPVSSIKDKIKHHIIDENFKGIGVMLENDRIVFTRAYGIDKTEGISKKKISELKLIKYGKLIKLLGGEANSLIVKDNIIFAIGLTDGSFHPLERVEYNKDVHKLRFIEFNYEFELDANNSDENNSTKFMSSYKSDDEMYNNLKSELKLFFSAKTKKIDTIRDDIYNIISQIDITKKRKGLFKVITFIVNNITISKSSIKTVKNNNRLTNKTKKCGATKHATPSPNKKGEIEINGKKIEINFPKCNLVLKSGLKRRYISKLTEEILFSLLEREEILMGKYLYNENGTNVLVEGDKYMKYVNSIFDIKNMYLSQNTTLNMWPITLGNSKLIDLDLIKKPLTKIEDIKYTLSDEEIQAAKNQNDEFEDKVGKIKNIKGEEIKDKNIKEGKCIFPFRVKGNSFLNTQCILHKDKDNGYICATEVDNNNVMTKYGFCYDGKCNSDIFGSDVDTMGKKHKNVYGIPTKPGYCCFPYIDTDGTSYDKYKETDKGLICATSVYDKDINNENLNVKKGQIKTVGFYPFPENKRMTKTGNKCIFPFKNRSNTGKEKIFNKCIVRKPNETVKQNSSKNRLVCPIKTNKKLGTKPKIDYDICVDHDIDEIDYSKWEKIDGALPGRKKTDLILKVPVKKRNKEENANPTLPQQVGKKYNTVKQALDVCSTSKLCKGVTESHKGGIYLSVDNKPLTKNEKTYTSWIKK